MASQKCVLVTGAGGRTGGLVFQALLANDAYHVVGMVRSEESANKLRKLGARDNNIVIADITDPASLKGAMNGIQAIICCTSAMPKIHPFSIVKLLFKKPFVPDAMPKFYWCPNGEPEKVDWLGAKAQIDAAKEAGVGHFIFVSSMAGTMPEFYLNNFGKKKDGTGGDLLLWKRKAEIYLTKSGVPYTIIHPGHLLDKKGGQSKLLIDVNDKFMDRKFPSLPREDLAAVCVQSLDLPAAVNASFDIIAETAGKGQSTKNFASLIGGLQGTTDYSVFTEPLSMAAVAH